MKYIHSSKFPFASKADKEFLLHGFNDVLINVIRIDECHEGIQVNGFIEVSYLGVSRVEGVEKYGFSGFVPLHRIHEVYRSLLIIDPQPYERDFSDKLLPISFGVAVEALKKGCYVARAGWNGKGMYLFLIGTDSTQPGIGGWSFTNGMNDNKQLLPFIAMKTADDKVVPWLASQTDLLADDWMIIYDCGAIATECNSLLNDQTPPLADFINMC